MAVDMQNDKLGNLRFLSEDQIRILASKYKTPFYVYSKKELLRAANEVLKFQKQMPFGCVVRYASKANDHPEILKFFNQQGIAFDASSSYEADNIIKCGIDPSKILLTSQQMPDNLASYINQGVKFTATSLHQLQTYCSLFPGTPLAIRINPGMGHGFNNRNTTGGVSASFGIWHEYIPEALEIINSHSNELERLHMHIGTGSDPNKWVKAAKICLDIVRELPSVSILNIGGGFKTAYMPGDIETNMSEVGTKIAELVKIFAEETGRKLVIEIEPGRFLSVHAGSIISRVIDLTDTGKNGYKFIRTDTGMTEIQRPAMYGAQHQLVVVPSKIDDPPKYDNYVVMGHCCESGDCLTVVRDDPERLETRKLRTPKIGDYLIIESTGAYCASMSAHGYNGFPSAKEIFI